MMDNADIAALLADQMDVRRKSVGMTIGIVSPKGRRVISHGVVERGSAAPVDSRTPFELASISKLFTGLLVADMIRRGEVTIADPVDSLLPAGMTAPTWKGRALTLLALATHTAGLPAMPPDAPTLTDPALAGYSVDRLVRAFCDYTLTRPPGRWEYSNWDTSLLGHLLARRIGMDFEAVIEQRVTRPLGLTSTAVEPTRSMRKPVSHSADLTVTPRLRMGAFAPAGGFMSTADDMLTFAAALLELTSSPLAGLLDVMTSTRRPIRPPFVKIFKDNWRMVLRMIFSPPEGMRRTVRYFSGAEAGLAWFIFKKGRREMIVHDGAAPACQGSLAIDRQARTAVVVLSNTGINIHDVSPTCSGPTIRSRELGRR
jgi:D-alanyl-D-alanine-carboxypeptidase/D-alanyl-D-alanine-endopeptidase